MARHKDTEWVLDEKNPGFAGAQLAVLMDIRDELKRMNSLFHCIRFQSMPGTLESIRRNTAKPRPKKGTA